MNNNVRTIKRVRHTHARFAALGLTKDSGGGNEDGEGAEAAPGFNAQTSSAVGPGPGLGTGGLGSDPMDVEEAIDDRVDERPWEVPTRRGRKISGIEIGSENADDCLRWMNGKVLEHAGFQGMSFRFFLQSCYRVSFRWILSSPLLMAIAPSYTMCCVFWNANTFFSHGSCLYP